MVIFISQEVCVVKQWGCLESPSCLVNNSFLISDEFDLMEMNSGCAVFTYLPLESDVLIAPVTPTCLCE